MKNPNMARKGSINRWYKHGATGTRTHRQYCSMIARCSYINDGRYDHYGGVGITVCERWRGENGYVNFVADVGECPSEKYSIDRYPVCNANYEPGNVRWATRLEQARNKSNINRFEFNGKNLTLEEWILEPEIIKLGLTTGAIYHRWERNWTTEQIFTTPRYGKRRNSGRRREVRSYHQQETEGLFTAKEIAPILDRSPVRIRQLIVELGLRPKRIDGMALLNDGEVSLIVQRIKQRKKNVA